MQTTLSVRHGDVPESLKQYAIDEVNGLARYFERLVEADITLDQQGHRYIVEVRVHSTTDSHFASSEGNDFRTAIDDTTRKLRRQLKKHKSKLNRRPISREARDERYGASLEITDDLRADGEKAPSSWDRISSREATARLEASGEDVLVFVDSIDGVVKIAKRNSDGAVGVVEAETFEAEER